MARLLLGRGLKGAEVPHSVLSPAFLVLEQDTEGNAARIEHLSLADLTHLDATHVGAGAASPAVLYNFATWERKLAHLFRSERTKVAVTDVVEEKQKRAEKKKTKKKRKRKQQEVRDVVVAVSLPSIGNGLEVRELGEGRRALFSTREFRPKETVAQYGGELIGELEAERRKEAERDRWIRVIKTHKLYQDAYDLQSRKSDAGTPAGSFARIAKDRKEANAKLVRMEEKNTHGLAVRAIKTIAPGDEIVVHYVAIYWPSEPLEEQKERVERVEEQAAKQLPSKVRFSAPNKRELRRALASIGLGAMYWLNAADQTTLHATRMVYDEDAGLTLLAVADLNNGLQYDFETAAILFVRFSADLADSVYIKRVDDESDAVGVEMSFDLETGKMVVYPSDEDELTGGEEYEFTRGTADEYLAANALDRQTPPPFSMSDALLPHAMYQLGKRNVFALAQDQEIVVSGRRPARFLPKIIANSVDARVAARDYPLLPISGEEERWMVKASVDTPTGLLWIRESFSSDLQVYFKTPGKEMVKQRDLLSWEPGTTLAATASELLTPDSLDRALLAVTTGDGTAMAVMEEDDDDEVESESESEQEKVAGLGLLLNAVIELPVSNALKDQLLAFCGEDASATENSPVAWTATTLQKKFKGLRHNAVETLLGRIVQRMKSKGSRSYVLYALVRIPEDEHTLSTKTPEELGFEVVEGGVSGAIQTITNVSTEHRHPQVISGFMLVALDINTSSLTGAHTKVGTAVIELMCVPGRDVLARFVPFFDNLRDVHKIKRVVVSLQRNLATVEQFVSVLAFKQTKSNASDIARLSKDL